MHNIQLQYFCTFQNGLRFSLLVLTCMYIYFPPHPPFFFFFFLNTMAFWTAVCLARSYSRPAWVGFTLLAAMLGDGLKECPVPGLYFPTFSLSLHGQCAMLGWVPQGETTVLLGTVGPAFIFSWHLPPSPLSRVFSVARGATDVSGGYWRSLNQKTPWWSPGWVGCEEEGRGMTVVVWFVCLFSSLNEKAFPSFVVPFVSTLGILLTRLEGSGWGHPQKSFQKPELNKLCKRTLHSPRQTVPRAVGCCCLQGRPDPSAQALFPVAPVRRCPGGAAHRSIVSLAVVPKVACVSSMRGASSFRLPWTLTP